MRIRRFDREYSRRKFLQDAGRGVLATGVLAPLWPTIAATGDVKKAYPEELLSIEAYTKGKV
ncbi:MAG: twin-arginine translocation signal domain-containing protein, partial [Salinisphaera sp.]|nr:twin-arginine translocation signal domain-containing protein [Salinisphaera sp.]